MLSIQTNVASLNALENLRVNTNFQNNTIQQLTSGYRINNSGDDPAGLAVANGYRNNIAELNQGVSNANDGLSQLQIIDGGLSNISQILDRMKTLATQSASTTFTGDRATLNNEYQSLVTEINRQAANVGLNTGGQYNSNIAVYIGGGGTVQSNSIVNIDLSGATNAADANALGLTGTTLLSGGTDFTGDNVNLNTETGPALLSGAANDSQSFTINLAGGTIVNASITSGTATGGITVSDAVQQLNNQLASSGITASVDQTTGKLMFTGNVAFTAKAGTAGGGSIGLTQAGALVQNSSNYITNGAASYVAPSVGESLTVTNSASGAQVTVALAANTTIGQAVAQLNTNLAAVGVNAVVNSAGSGIDFQGTAAFTVADTNTAADGVFGAITTATAENPNAPAASVNGTTGNALTALTAVTNAVSNMGLVQGTVGAGENKLNYAINLAESQVTNFSSAESDIRDADVATEAANLTKAQVLQQTTMAAMAQANSAPQQVLTLLRG